MDEYIVVYGSSRQTIRENVDAKIAEGIYTPIGGVTRDSANGAFFQTMIKKSYLFDIAKEALNNEDIRKMLVDIIKDGNPGPH